MRRAADDLMRRLARLLVRVFFRSVEIRGDTPALTAASRQPTVVVANHTNGLVDALLLMSSIGRFPRFLAKSTLFRIPLLWPFLRLAGAIPVFRSIDGQPTTRNTATFRASRHLLELGGLVALFPEGISHDESTLQELRTGAARIALESAFDDGVAGVVTLTVGLTYDAKARFRSRALVRIGPEMPVASWRSAYQDDAHAAARALTADLARRLVELSPSYARHLALRRTAGANRRPPGRCPPGSPTASFDGFPADRACEGRRARE